MLFNLHLTCFLKKCWDEVFVPWPMTELSLPELLIFQITRISNSFGIIRLTHRALLHIPLSHNAFSQDCCSEETFGMFGIIGGVRKKRTNNVNLVFSHPMRVQSRQKSSWFFSDFLFLTSSSSSAFSSKSAQRNVQSNSQEPLRTAHFTFVVLASCLLLT